MSLTSPILFTVVLLAAVLLFLFTVLMWRHIYKRGFANLILRAILLLLVNILLIAATALGINRSQGFFESWGDLFGTSSTYSVKTVSYTHLLSVAELARAKQIGGGYLMLTEGIKGKGSGVQSTVTLLLPPSAKKNLLEKKPLSIDRYRVVEFLTGFPSQPAMWFQALGLAQDVESYNSLHPDSQIIAIVPQVNIEGSFDLECMNLPAPHPQAETWLTEDMHAYIESRLGITSSKFGLMGVSTGGWCAAMFAIKHPELYFGAVSIAGYYRPALPLKDPLNLQDSMKVKYDLAQFEKVLKARVPLYIVASKGDKYSIRETTRYLAMPHPNLEISYHEIVSGGHNPRVWKSVIEPGLEWLLAH